MALPNNRTIFDMGRLRTAHREAERIAASMCAENEFVEMSSGFFVRVGDIREAIAALWIQSRQPETTRSVWEQVYANADSEAQHEMQQFLHRIMAPDAEENTEEANARREHPDGRTDYTEMDGMTLDEAFAALRELGKQYGT